jgi:hypothetical protein
MDRPQKVHVAGRSLAAGSPPLLRCSGPSALAIRTCVAPDRKKRTMSSTTPPSASSVILPLPPRDRLASMPPSLDTELPRSAPSEDAPCHMSGHLHPSPLPSHGAAHFSLASLHFALVAAIWGTADFLPRCPRVVPITNCGLPHPCTGWSLAMCMLHRRPVPSFTDLARPKFTPWNYQSSARCRTEGRFRERQIPFEITARFEPTSRFPKDRQFRASPNPLRIFRSCRLLRRAQVCHHNS